MEILNEQFNSPEAFVRRITSRKAKWAWRDKKENLGNFYGANTTWEALEMFAIGWTEQAQKMKRLEDDIFAQLTTGVERFDPVYVEADGHSLDIGAYCAGEPEHWMRFQPTTVDGQSNRILRIAINIAAMNAVDHDVIIERGTIGASIIEALEYRGFRVEAWIVKGTQGPNTIHYWRMLLKPADQPLNLARMLFMSAHPAMLRRLHFALAASIEHPEKIGCVPNGGMGMSADFEDTSDFDIYVPAQLENDNPINWMDTSARNTWLKAQIEKIETQRQ